MWVCKNREDSTYAIGNPQLMAHEPMRISVQNWNLIFDEEVWVAKIKVGAHQAACRAECFLG
jgi:hypothetical protein